MKRILLLIFSFLLASCHSPQPKSGLNQGDYTLPFNEWGFVFFTPKHLYAVVTDAIIVDTTGRMYRFYTLDMPQDDWDALGTWNKFYNGHYFFNSVKHPAPPQYLVFCWDSWVDKKHYETSMLFTEPVWLRMMTPSAHEPYPGQTKWYDTLLIGLAPGGTVKVWFKSIGKYANIPFQPKDLQTLSGDKLKVCKGLSKNTFSKNIIPDTAEFIKGKKYPYGEW